MFAVQPRELQLVQRFGYVEAEKGKPEECRNRNNEILKPGSDEEERKRRSDTKRGVKSRFLDSKPRRLCSDCPNSYQDNDEGCEHAKRDGQTLHSRHSPDFAWAQTGL